MEKKRTLLGISFFAFISLGLSSTVLNIAWIYIEETFNVSLDKLGVLLGAGMVGYLLGAFLNGRIIARLGVGRLLILGSGTACVGLLGYATAPVWVVLLAAAMITSFGKGLIDAGLNTFLSANFNAGHMNWLHAFFGVGSTLGPLLATFFVVTLDQSWRLAYASLLVVEVCVITSVLVTLPHWTLKDANLEPVATTKTARNSDPGIWETLRAPMVIWGLMLFFLYGGVEMGTGQLANSLMVDGRGIDQATASFWVSVYWGSFTIGRMLAGVFASRFSVRHLMRTCMGGMLVGAALLWWNIAGLTGFLGLAVLGFAQAPIFATMTSDTPRRVGVRHVPNTIGFQLGVTVLAGAFLPGFAAAMAESAGLEIIGLMITASTIALYLLYEAMVWREAHRPLDQPLASAQ
jgi:fucose permease